MGAFSTSSTLLTLGIACALLTGAARADIYDDTKSQARVVQNSEVLQKLLATAARGDAESQFKLGLMYHLGKTVPQNFKRASQWYRLASSGGSADARNNLGVIYRDGLGVPQNDVMAYMWFSLAASDQGPYGLARKNRDRLGGGMAPDLILQAQQLGEEYLRSLASSRRKLAAMAAAKLHAPKTGSPDSETARRAVETTRSGGKKMARLEPARGRPATGDAQDANAAENWIGNQIRALAALFAPDEAKTPKYLVQLGLFERDDNVQRVQERLTRADIDLHVEKVVVRGRPYKRLRVGPYDDDTSARKVAQRVDRMFRIKSLLVPTTY